MKQTEEARWKLFEAQLKSKLQEAEGSVVKDEIDLCGEVRFIWWQTSSQANFKFVGKKSIIENELQSLFRSPPPTKEQVSERGK